MAGAGNGSNASNAGVAGGAGTAGRDGGVSEVPVDRDKSWANARRRRWFGGLVMLPVITSRRLRARWVTQPET